MVNAHDGIIQQLFPVHQWNRNRGHPQADEDDAPADWR
jgi:hypothetical protein